MTHLPGPPFGDAAPAQQYCSFHPDRPTALSCTRCGRPACPADLAPAAVGFQCVACVQEGRSAQREPRTFAGSRLGEKPLVTFVLLAINLAVFVLCAVQAGGVLGVSASWAGSHGSLVPDLVAQGEYWRLLTSGFLHSGLEHIAFNMISLVLLGLPLERMLGRVRFLVVYLLSLLGGSVAVMWFESANVPTVGASGAIFGLMGALLLTAKRMNADPRQLIIILAINLFITFRFSGISWQGHLGGLVIGAIIGAIMVYPPARVRKAWQVGGSVALAVVLMLAVAIRVPQVEQWGCHVAADDQIYCLVKPLSELTRST